MLIFWQLGINLVQHRILLRRAPGVGDLRQAACDFRAGACQFVEDGVAPPDEHAAVPVVAAGFDIAVGRRLVGLFLERLHAVRAAGLAANRQRFAAMDVAQAGVAVRRDDAEGDQRIRDLGDDVKAGFDRVLKHVDRLDDMIGRHEGGDRVLVALGQNRGGEADGVGGVAPFGSPSRFSFGSSGRFSSTASPWAAPVQTKIRSGGSMPAKALVAELQQALAAHRH